jgi:hypothetical protein
MARNGEINAILDKYANSDAKLKIDEVSDEGYRSVLIEGNKTALNFLAELLQAVAAAKDCGFEISPNGPGNLFFAPDSKFGVYLHLTDGAGEHNGTAELR